MAGIKETITIADSGASSTLNKVNAAAERLAKTYERLARQQSQALRSSGFNNAMSGNVQRLEAGARAASLFGNALGAISFIGLIHGLQTTGNMLYNQISGLQEYADMVRSISFRMQEFGTSTGKQAFDNIGEMARESRASIDSVGQLASRILISGAKGENDRASTRIAGIASKATFIGGSSAGESERALIQLSQGLASNQLGGDELRAIREQAPGLMKVLAEGISQIEGFGQVSIGELKALGAEGKLTADVVTTALLNMEDKVTQQFESAPKTWGQGIEMLKNRWIEFIADMSQPEEPLDRLNQKLWQLVDYVSSDRGAWIFETIEGGINYVIEAIEYLQPKIEDLMYSLRAEDFSGFKSLADIAVQGLGWAVEHARGLLAAVIAINVASKGFRVAGGIMMLVSLLKTGRASALAMKGAMTGVNTAAAAGTVIQKAYTAETLAQASANAAAAATEKARFGFLIPSTNAATAATTALSAAQMAIPWIALAAGIAVFTAALIRSAGASERAERAAKKAGDAMDLRLSDLHLQYKVEFSANMNAQQMSNEVTSMALGLQEETQRLLDDANEKIAELKDTGKDTSFSLYNWLAQAGAAMADSQTGGYEGYFPEVQETNPIWEQSEASKVAEEEKSRILANQEMQAEANAANEQAMTDYYARLAEIVGNYADLNEEQLGELTAQNEGWITPLLDNLEELASNMPDAKVADMADNFRTSAIQANAAAGNIAAMDAAARGLPVSKVMKIVADAGGAIQTINGVEMMQIADKWFTIRSKVILPRIATKNGIDPGGGTTQQIVVDGFDETAAPPGSGGGSTPTRSTGGRLDSVDKVGLDEQATKYLQDIASNKYLIKLRQTTPNINVTFGDVKESADPAKIMDALEQSIVNKWSSNSNN